MGLWGSIKNTVKKIASPALTIAGVATGNPLLVAAGGATSALNNGGSTAATSNNVSSGDLTQSYINQMAADKLGYANQYKTRNNQLGSVASDLLGYVNGDSSNTNGSAPATLWVPNSDEVLSTRPALQTYSGTLATPTASALSPRISTTTDLSSVSAVPSSSANTNLGKLGQVATYDSSGMPTADTLLSVLNNTPDPDAVEAKVNRAYNVVNDLNLQKQTDQTQTALDADAARRGITGSNLDRSAQIGLRNWQRTTGAQLGAQGVLAGLDAAASTRAERTANATTADNTVMNRYLSAQDLLQANRQAQENYAGNLDTQDTNLRGEGVNRLLQQQESNLAENQDLRASDLAKADLTRQNWQDANDTISKSRDWFNEDQTAKDARWTSDQAVASQLRDEKSTNMWNALNWLSGDTSRLSSAADLVPLINAENGVTSNQTAAAQVAAQNSANKNSLWASILGAAGTAYGAYAGAKSK